MTTDEQTDAPDAQHVFISYASQDADGSGRKIAERLVEELEARDIRCWAAWRDIAAGRRYAGEIHRAIAGSRALVVVLSPAALESEHVLNEIELAYHQHVEILPIKVEPTTVTGEVAYYLSRRQWLDATDRPLSICVDDLAAAIAGGLSDDAPGFVKGGRTERAGWLRRVVRRHPVGFGCTVLAALCFLVAVWVVHQAWTSVGSLQRGEMPDGVGGDLMERQMRAMLGDRFAQVRVTTDPAGADVLLIGPEESVERGKSPFRPMYAMTGHYSVLAHADGYLVARREFEAQGPDGVNEVEIELQRDPGDQPRIEMDLGELAGRQIHFLEREVVVRGALAVTTRFASSWDEVSHDHFAFSLHPPSGADAPWHGGSTSTVYIRNDDRGAGLRRELPKDGYRTRSGTFTIRIPMARYDPDDDDEVHAELLSWMFDR